MGKILERIKSSGTLVSDGAWGTLLQEKGLGSGECPESWNLKNPDAVFEVAKSYVDAGADLILTNSFGGSPFKLEPYGLKEQVVEINRAAAEISRRAAAEIPGKAAENPGRVAAEISGRAAENSGRAAAEISGREAGEPVLVLGSMGPTGKMIMMGEVSEEEVLEGFRLQARGLVKGGVDALLVETMSDIQEAVLALQAARSESDLELICTFTFERNVDGVYRTMMGAGVKEAVEAAMQQGADIVGANCGNGTAGMIDIVTEIRRHFPDVPVLVHANAGLPEYRDGMTVFPESPSEMSIQMKELAARGASIIGGCCGTTPAHITEIVRAIR